MYTDQSWRLRRPHSYFMCHVKKDIDHEAFGRNKKDSSRWIKTKGKEYEGFYWQDGYGIFSVNPSELEIVVKYISNQKLHHENKNFQDEYRGFLRKYNVEYDERYVWD